MLKLQRSIERFHSIGHISVFRPAGPDVSPVRPLLHTGVVAAYGESCHKHGSCPDDRSSPQVAPGSLLPPPNHLFDGECQEDRKAWDQMDAIAVCDEERKDAADGGDERQAQETPV